MDTVFSLSSLLVMPFWFLMIFLPTWRWTRRLMRSPWTVAPVAALYLVLVVPNLPTVFPAVMNPELAGIAALLSTEAGASIAWAHFLAFDLFVGRWVYLDSREQNIHPFVMAPILFFTLMLGPVGFLLYLAARSVSGMARVPAPQPQQEWRHVR